MCHKQQLKLGQDRDDISPKGIFSQKSTSRKLNFAGLFLLFHGVRGKDKCPSANVFHRTSCYEVANSHKAQSEIKSQNGSISFNKNYPKNTQCAQSEEGADECWRHGCNNPPVSNLVFSYQSIGIGA